MRAFLSCLPALLAVLLIAVSPGCASLQSADSEPAETAVKSRPADYVGGIERGAGQVVSDDAADQAYILAGYVAGAIMLGLFWLVWLLIEVIADSLDRPYEEVAEMIRQETTG